MTAAPFKNYYLAMPPELITLALSESTDLSSKWTDILRVGDWSNSYKEFEITQEDLENIVRNFELNVLKIDEKELQFNYSHQSYKEAAGWIEALQINGSTLQAKVRWTKTAKERIADEEYKYVSAELDLSYRDEESGAKHGTTLTGAALTNIPFVRGMKAVALSNDAQDSKKIFILSNENQRMKNFQKLLSEMAALTNLSAVQFAKVEGAHAMLSEDEQAEAQKALDALAEKVAEDTTVTELSTAKTKIASLEAQVAKGGEQNLSETQKELAAANERIATLELDSRQKDLDVKLDSLVESGKLLSKSRDDMAKNLMGMSLDQQEAMLTILEGQAPAVALDTELGSGESATEDAEDAKDQEAAKALMKEDSSLTLSDALSAVYREKSLQTNK